MPAYQFGKYGECPDYRGGYTVTAKSLEAAVKVFKVSVLFPENYVHKSFYDTCKNSYELDRYVLHGLKPDAKIFIYERVDKENHHTEWPKVGEVLLSDCINVNYSELIPTPKMLTASPLEKPEEVTSQQLAVIGDSSILPTSTKHQLRRIHDQVNLERARLKGMLAELNDSMKALEKEITRKQKALYAFETLLGVREEVIQLVKGQDAPEEEPLTLYQQLLFMDEELGIWEAGGIDVRNIEDFDAWISKHYKQLIPSVKSVTAWRVRRKDKRYCEEAFDNFMLNLEYGTRMTYFLIRNGDNLYRIWSDVTVQDTLFPAADEYQKILERSDFRAWAEEDVKKLHEKYMYGLIAIQGLIVRTDIFGTKLREHVNFLTGDLGDRIQLIYDADRSHWLASGMSWKDFLVRNQATIQQGSRVILDWYSIFPSGYFIKDGYVRTQPFRPENAPDRKEIYIIEDTYESRYDGRTFIIRYAPKDIIYSRWSWDSHERKNRVPFRVSADELLNVDEITLPQIEYYLKSRIDREDYLSMLPALFTVKALKEQEAALEIEFAKLMLRALGFEQGSVYIIDVLDAINWWKLKNKWKRGLTKDDAKAWRMIKRRLQNRI